jgi:hypothetical protein
MKKGISEGMECVVKLFTEAYKSKHKPQWTSENRGLKSRTSNKYR